MGYRDEIKKLISSLLHEHSPQYEDILRLVHITSAVSKSYLKNYYPSFLRLCVQNGLNEEDLAEDSILQMFARNEKGEYIILKNFMHSLDTSFEETESEEIFKAYQAFVHTMALRQLIKTYSEIDSAGAKIYRNIRDSIQKIDGISMIRDYRGLVITPSNNSSREHLPAIPFRELEQTFITNITKPYTTPELLTTVMSELQKQNRYRNSVPFFQVVKLFKRHYSNITDNEVETDKKIDLTSLSKFDHSIMKGEVFKTVREKILTTYVVSGKISFDEANLLYQTIVDIVNTWFDNQKESETIYSYVHLNFGVDETEYEQNWRTKIEYLVRIARNQLRMYLLEGL
jgi:hypothetical protein